MINKDRFARLLSPKSIVVFGSVGADHAIRESRKFGFQGEIWAVHPKRDEIEGLKCYRSVDELPGVPDAAYVAVNADAAIKIVGDLDRVGCGGAVLYASGFSEVGEEGAARQKILVEAAGNMPIIGPNCYGMLNCIDRAVLWPDQHGCKAVEKGVAIITQSGNIGLNMTMQQRGLPLAFMFTMGNQAAVSIADVMDALLDDDRVTAIGLHIEGISDVGEFDRVSRRALEKKIPIIALKSGRSEAAAKIAMSHTSSLTGSDALFDALFRRVGIARVDTVPEFLETLKLVSVIGPLSGNRVASMSCSGGEAGMMADLIERHQVCFPAMGNDHVADVQATLSDYVHVANPLDYHTFIWGKPDQLEATFAAMIKGGEYDATMLLLDWPNYDGANPEAWDAAMNALARASKKTGFKGIVVASMAECLPDHAIKACVDQGVAPMIGLDRCLGALGHAHEIGKAFDRPVPNPIATTTGEGAEGRIIDEWRSKRSLLSHGLSVPEGALVTSATEAVAAAEALGYPVVVKAVGSHLAHKTEMGAVKLNLTDGNAVDAAVTDMAGLSDKFMVEKMVPGFVAELIVGISRDDQFGPTLVLGAGGILVELLQDSATLLLPTDRETVRNALQGLKSYKLLEGYRGKPAGDLEAVIDSVMAVAAFAEANKETLQELDINPLMVCEAGKGAVAADALIRIAE
ncbi:acetate--CoA ligase family protein [Aestuariispira insulae]|uniref:Acyl-CoA synthetase (NDP forming) n=1 Tax=Aestuariispira insulae TaxID=1461337 RepID=A0A3D9HVA8_9PROT|nr:acetate--CoA ligase family protein [Aestuariispira insulae]RED53345.1 acyl-CoA synthetase (NDP forming) [Aestuariispira insulae]